MASSNPTRHGNRFIDITGERFGRLLVVAYLRTIGSQTLWLCRCDCGEEVIRRRQRLSRGESVSCGCYRRENTGAMFRTHGKTGTTEYRVWVGMRERCLRTDSVSYRDYGGRGITICERWMTFEHFLADMGRRPSRKHTIDRIDNDKGYEPGNCRWATKTRQARNRRSNLMISYLGKTLCLADWSEITGVPTFTIQYRLARGLPMDLVFDTTDRRHKEPTRLTRQPRRASSSPASLAPVRQGVLWP